MNEDLKNPVSFAVAVGRLRAGGICAFPTDTVYGLGARSDSSGAINGLFQAKRRPPSRAVIALCADPVQVEQLVQVNAVAQKLMAFWPGALTLVLPLKPDAAVAPEMHRGLDSLGVRIPASSLTLDLIRAVGVPLATSSANISGRPTPQSPLEVARQFGGAVPVLAPREQDALSSPSSEASTILAVKGERVDLLRSGALALRDIEERLGFSLNRNVPAG